MLVERSAGAEAPKPFMPTKAAALAEPAVPAEAAPRPRPRPRGARAEHRVAVVLRAGARTAPSTASRRPRRGCRPSASSVARRHRERDLGAGGEQGHLARRPRPRPAHRRRARERFSAAGVGAQQRHVLAGQRQDRRRVRAASAPAAQHSAVSTASAGRKTSRLRDRAQRRQMLDRLVGRAVLAEADRVVRHHVDDPRCPSGPPGGSPGGSSR